VRDMLSIVLLMFRFIREMAPRSMRPSLNYSSHLFVFTVELSTYVACPLQSSDQFIYNSNSAGFCRQPTATIQKCASDSQLRVHLKQCHEHPYSKEKGMNALHGEPKVIMAAWCSG